LNINKITKFDLFYIKLQKFLRMAKSKVVPVQAVKAYRDIRGRTPLILDQGGR
jgi:hypothetical protein